jgi:hypothetical protein
MDEIAVFVSRPTNLSPRQMRSCDVLMGLLAELRLEPRTLGPSRYPARSAMKGVLQLARECYGGMILGFEQLHLSAGVRKRSTEQARVLRTPELAPTDWNQLEAGLLYGLGRPLVVFREAGIAGGIFDLGAFEGRVHDIPRDDEQPEHHADLRDVLIAWADDVRAYHARLASDRA